MVSRYFFLILLIFNGIDAKLKTNYQYLSDFTVKKEDGCLYYEPKTGNYKLAISITSNY